MLTVDLYFKNGVSVSFECEKFTSRVDSSTNKLVAFEAEGADFCKGAPYYVNVEEIACIYVTDNAEPTKDTEEE